ncbi:MAG: hypothetical protein HKN28_08760 [Alphaproteobacteria bacterium]|nr:hypothetical protein [Alphaproteobacteria bacterium]
MNFLRANNGVYELGKPPVETPRRVRGLIFVPILLSAVWVGLFAWFVGRSIGWNNLPLLLADQIGGIVAGFIAPPAVFFALMSMFANSLRTRETVAQLEAQVARLAMPQAEAEAGLVDLGEEMRGYAAILQRTIDQSRAQLDQLGTEFTERVEAMSEASAEAVENSRLQLQQLGDDFNTRVKTLSTAADTAVENSSAAGRSLSMHAEALT